MNGVSQVNNEFKGLSNNSVGTERPENCKEYGITREWGLGERNET